MNSILYFLEFCAAMFLALLVLPFILIIMAVGAVVDWFVSDGTQ